MIQRIRFEQTVNSQRVWKNEIRNESITENSISLKKQRNANIQDANI